MQLNEQDNKLNNYLNTLSIDIASIMGNSIIALFLVLYYQIRYNDIEGQLSRDHFPAFCNFVGAMFFENLRSYELFFVLLFMDTF